MNSRVLVVDDSYLIRQQVRRVLEEGAFEVSEAADGEAALHLLRVAGPVGLVVCDVNMLKMDGIAFLRALRADSSLAGTQVMMLTTEAQVDLVERAKALGAKAWMVKPFKPDLLLRAVRRLVAASSTALSE